MDHNTDARSHQGRDRDHKTYVSALSIWRYMLKRCLWQLSLHQRCASHVTTSQVGTCRGFSPDNLNQSVKSHLATNQSLSRRLSERIEYFYQTFVTVFQRSGFQDTGLQMQVNTPSQLVMKPLIHMKLDFRHSRHTTHIDETSKCEECSNWTHKIPDERHRVSIENFIHHQGIYHKMIVIAPTRIC